MSKRSRSRTRREKRIFKVGIVSSSYNTEDEEESEDDIYLVRAYNKVNAGEKALWLRVKAALEVASDDHFNDAEITYIYKDVVKKLGGKRIFTNTWGEPQFIKHDNIDKFYLDFSYFEIEEIKNFNLDEGVYITSCYNI